MHISGEVKKGDADYRLLLLPPLVHLIALFLVRDPPLIVGVGVRATELGRGRPWRHDHEARTM